MRLGFNGRMYDAFWRRFIFLITTGQTVFDW